MFYCNTPNLVYGRVVLAGETFNRFADFGLNCTKNAFGGRAPPEPAVGAKALPQAPGLMRRGEQKGKERVENKEGGN